MSFVIRSQVRKKDGETVVVFFENTNMVKSKAQDASKFPTKGEADAKAKLLNSYNYMGISGWISQPC
jgi:hypothetical protein